MFLSYTICQCVLSKNNLRVFTATDGDGEKSLLWFRSRWSVSESEIIALKNDKLINKM